MAGDATGVWKSVSFFLFLILFDLLCRRVKDKEEEA